MSYSTAHQESACDADANENRKAVGMKEACASYVRNSNIQPRDVGGIFAQDHSDLVQEWSKWASGCTARVIRAPRGRRHKEDEESVAA